MAKTINTSTTNAAPTSTSPIASSTPDPGTAFLARMGNDYSKKHSIPNAWMASTPSHPFWLLPLNLVAAGTEPYGDWPEAVTGPDALFHLVNRYLKEYDSDYDAKARLDEVLRRSELKDLYIRYVGEKDIGTRAGVRMHQMVLLEREMIFPYWWGEKRLESVCRAGVEGFDPETCKDVLDVQALSSWSITYWSHSWKQEGGHDEGQLSAMESWIGSSGRKLLRSGSNMKRQARECSWKEEGKFERNTRWIISRIGSRPIKERVFHEDAKCAKCSPCRARSRAGQLKVVGYSFLQNPWRKRRTNSRARKILFGTPPNARRRHFRYINIT